MTTALDGLAAALADRYRIERELGQGGMTTAYLAQDLKHDRYKRGDLIHQGSLEDGTPFGDWHL